MSEVSSLDRVHGAEDAFLAEVARSAGFGTYTLNLNNGKCECSSSLRAILRIESNENAHDYLGQGIEPEQRTMMDVSFNRLIANGGDDCFEHSFRSADGKTLTLLTRRRAICDGKSPAHSLISSIQDVSERNVAFGRLRESEERFEMAVSGTNDGLWDWNLLTNELYYSPQWKSMLGYEPNELGNESLR